MKTYNETRSRIVVVNRHKTGMKQHYFYVGRPSLLGNPFQSRDREANIRLYKNWLRRVYRSKPAVREIIDGLVELVRAGETVELACWCAPQPCHADVIRRFVLSLASTFLLTPIHFV
jgi:hypothetical protein